MVVIFNNYQRRSKGIGLLLLYLFAEPSLRLSLPKPPGREHIIILILTISTNAYYSSTTDIEQSTGVMSENESCQCKGRRNNV